MEVLIGSSLKRTILLRIIGIESPLCRRKISYQFGLWGSLCLLVSGPLGGVIEHIVKEMLNYGAYEVHGGHQDIYDRCLGC